MIDYGERIDKLLSDSELSGRVREYLNPESNFAAYSFNLDGPNPHSEFTSDDLLALNFLDVPIGPLTYRQFKKQEPDLSETLARVDPTVALWEVDENHPGYRAANELWEALDRIYGVGTITAHKLLARKRPHLIPILDSSVISFYERDTSQYWIPLGRALRDENRRSAIESLRPNDPRAHELSVLRILDIAIWSSRNQHDAAI